jgi:hypothetical protein
MKRIILIIIVFALIAVPVYAGLIRYFILLDEAVVVAGPAMDGCLANPAAVKIANPAGQNLSIN